jgi:hypothetical protein
LHAGVAQNLAPSHVAMAPRMALSERILRSNA